MTIVANKDHLSKDVTVKINLGNHGMKYTANLNVLLVNNKIVSMFQRVFKPQNFIIDMEISNAENNSTRKCSLNVLIKIYNAQWNSPLFHFRTI